MEMFRALLSVDEPCILNPRPILDEFLQQFVNAPMVGKTLPETIEHYRSVHQSPDLFFELLCQHAAFDDIQIKFVTTVRRFDCQGRCPLPSKVI